MSEMNTRLDPLLRNPEFQEMRYISQPRYAVWRWTSVLVTFAMIAVSFVQLWNSARGREATFSAMDESLKK